MMKAIEALLRLWPQWLATLLVTLLSISIGLANSWSSPYLAQLTSEDPPFRVTEEEASWIASLLPFGRILGAIVGALSMKYLDSKKSLVLTGLPLLVGWICEICATTATWLYVFRVLSGMSMGMIYTCYPFYISEISTPSIRGALLSMVTNALTIGHFFASVIGAYMSMTHFGIISITLILCYEIIFPFLPQSPHYFVRRDNMKRAEKSIQWYYRKSDIKVELEAVQRFVKSSYAITMREWLKQMKETKNRRAFIMIILLFMFMQSSGLNTVLFYLEIVVRKAMVTFIVPSHAVMIIMASSLFFGLTSVYFMDRCGRRMLLLISSTGGMIGVILLGLHFCLLDLNYDPIELQWLPIFSLLIFNMIFLGLVPVPYTLLGELFPTPLKSTAGLIGSIAAATFAFVATKTYQPLTDLMSEKYVFWIYAIIIGICIIYSFAIVPETNGKTLQEIQDMMTTGSAIKSSRQKSHTETECITRF